MRAWVVSLVLLVLVAAAGCSEGDSSVLGTPETEPSEETTGSTDSATSTTSPAPVEVESGAATSGSLVLLADDFQDGDAADWVIDDGWFIHGAGAAYTLASSGTAWAWWPAGETWSPPYAARLSARIDEGSLAFSVMVGSAGRYVVHLHEAGTDLLLDRPWGSLQTLTSSAPITYGEWHSIAVGVSGGEIQVYVDAVPWLRYQVGDPLATGSIGLGALEGSRVAVDNVLVAALRGQLPGPGAFPAPIEAEPASPDLFEDDSIVEEPEAETDLPDLVFAGVDLDRAQYEPGDPITATVSVRNAGGAAAGPVSVMFVVGDAGCGVEITSIAPGQTADGTCTSAGVPESVELWEVFVDDDERIGESNEINNLAWGSIHVTSAGVETPNLVVYGYGFIPDPVVAGEPYDLVAETLDDSGFSGEIGPHTVRFLVDGQAACSLDVSGTGITGRCTAPSVTAGAHVLEIVVDADNDIAESREDDNRKSFEFEAVGGAGASEEVDLTITYVTFQPPDPRAGQEFTVSLWFLANPIEGDPLPDYVVRWVLEDGGVACEWGTDTRTEVLSCTWRFDAPGSYRWRGRVDATDTVAETDEDDNVLTGTLTVSP